MCTRNWVRTILIPYARRDTRYLRRAGSEIDNLGHNLSTPITAREAELLMGDHDGRGIKEPWDMKPSRYTELETTPCICLVSEDAQALHRH
jgi:hypothetical protein